MNIEIVEFYPDQKGKFLGTLHMYLIEDKMDLRGVQVFKDKKHLHILPPSIRGTDGKKYGCVSFVDQKKQVDFLKEVSRSGIEYMRKLEKKEPS